MKQYYFDIDDVDLKARLKSFISSQTEFSAHNFDSSNLSQLLDILVPITKQMIFFNNMTLNEWFLDTASLRKNVVSIAKQLGYTPNRGITATGSVLATDPNAGGGNALHVTAGETFTINGYEFYASETVDFTSAPTSLSVDIPVTQGVLTATYYTTLSVGVEELNANFFRIELPYNEAIAMNAAFTVEVQIGSEAYEIYEDARKRENPIDGTSEYGKVYWLKEIDEVLYVYFGDGFVGKNVPFSVGNTVRITYTVTDMSSGNTEISASVTPDTISGYNITTPYAISGGRMKETMTEIKANAPLFYNSANRCVNEKDYVAVMKDAGIQYCNSWGGEKEMFSVSDSEWLPDQYAGAAVNVAYTAGDILNVANKALYRCVVDDTLTQLSDIWNAHSSSWEKYGHVDLGKTYISALTRSGGTNSYYVLTQYNNVWSSMIGSKRPSSFIPEFIDPCEMFIDMSVNIYYKNINLVMSSYDAQIKAFIDNYFLTNYIGYDKSLYTGQIISEVIRNFNVVNNVTISLSVRVKINDQSEYNPQHLSTKIFKRTFTEMQQYGARFINSTNFYYVDQYGLITKSGVYVGDVNVTTGLISINDNTVIDENLEFSFTPSNQTTINCQKEMFMCMGDTTVHGFTV